MAFIVAVITAFSYLELVTKYPKAAGAALYTHKAFGIHFVTFIITFAVMCSGITSASTASQAESGLRWWGWPFLPVLGALSCAFLAGPCTSRDSIQYKIAGILIGIGIVLWLVTVLINRATGQKPVGHVMENIGTRGPVN